MRTNLFFITSNLSTRLLVYSSTYYVTLSFSQATCLLVYLFTRLLTMLLCLFHKQLVYLSTYYVTLSFSQATRSLVHSFTRLLITLPHTLRIGSIFSASLRRIIAFFSAKTWHYSKKVVSLLH